MEPHITSKQLSERLKVLGVPQKSQYKWWQGAGQAYLRPTDWSQFNMEPKPMYETADLKETFSAYLSSEIGNWLPAGLRTIKEGASFTVMLTPHLVEKRKSHGKLYPQFNSPTEIEARGKMLEYLIINGFISVDNLK